MVDRALLEQLLDEYLEGESWPRHVETDDGQYDEDAPETPKDVITAAGIMRRLKRLDREATAIADVAQVEIDRISRWRDDLVAGHERERAWGERALEAFMRNHHEASHKLSLPLADGTLKLRNPSKGGKIVIDDEAAFIAWAKQHDAVGTGDPAQPPSPVNPKPVPSKTVIGEWYKTGKEPIARTIDDDGVEADVYPILGPDGGPIPGINRVVAVASKFSVTLGED